MELARMTSKGQLTIPVSIRKKFGIGTGDQLLFYEHDGHIILAPVTPASLAAAQEAAAKQHIYTLDEIRSIARSQNAIGLKSWRFLALMRVVKQQNKATWIFLLIFPMISACSVLPSCKTIWKMLFIKRLTSLPAEC